MSGDTSYNDIDKEFIDDSGVRHAFISGQEYVEDTIDIGDITDTDLVLGTDGKWHQQTPLIIHKTARMFRLGFETQNNQNSPIGTVDCTDSHEWVYYKRVGGADELKRFDNPAYMIYSLLSISGKEFLSSEYTEENGYLGYLAKEEIHFGEENGPKLIFIEEIEPAESRCISINYGKDENGNDIDGDMLFAIYLDNGETVFTHNCQERFVCGRLGSVASMMALGNTQATAIDGSHKGAGMVYSQGIISNVQYYYCDPTWIRDWFTARGLTEKGWETWEDPNASIDASSIDLGDDEENIDMSDNKTVIDFQDIHAEIDNSKDQKFKEV